MLQHVFCTERQVTCRWTRSQKSGLSQLVLHLILFVSIFSFTFVEYASFLLQINIEFVQLSHSGAIILLSCHEFLWRLKLANGKQVAGGNLKQKGNKLEY